MAGKNFCPACGVSVSIGAGFCAACGYKLSSPSVSDEDATRASKVATPSGKVTAGGFRKLTAADIAAMPGEVQYATEPPEGYAAAMEAEQASREQGVTHEQMSTPTTNPQGFGGVAQPGEGNEPSQFEMPPPPATPPAAPAGSWANSTGFKIGTLVVVLAIGAAILGPKILPSGSKDTPSSDSTANSGVIVTNATLSSWNSCDKVTKGYLPGATNCKASVTLQVSKPGVKSGYVVVEMFYGGGISDPFFHGTANVPTTVGETPASVKVTLNIENLKTCKPNPHVLILVHDRPLKDPATKLIAEYTGNFTDNCANFPKGGL